MLELWEIRDGGVLEARYFNPRPIHVGRAEIREQEDAIVAFIELRDVNYPGSMYTLQFHPKTDRLTGTYFQAVIGETFGVEFVRLR